MPQYLLATQTLLDIAKRDGNPAYQWFDTATPDRGVPVEDILISAVSPAIIEHSFRTRPSSIELRHFHDLVVRTVDRFVRAGLVVDITKDIADMWGRLHAEQLTYEISPAAADQPRQTGLYASHEKFVFATALIGIGGRPLTLVTRVHDAHRQLAAIGLLTEDPYEIFK